MPLTGMCYAPGGRKRATLDAAKQTTASKVLDAIANEEGFCMLNNKALFPKLLDSDSGNYSPISIVHEFASKGNLSASFTLISEEGPSHIKNFVFKCNIGDKFETFGEGGSKKVAKTEAAENMVQKLKSVMPDNSAACGTLKNYKPQKTSSKKLIESIVNSEKNTDEDYFIPDDLDPVSKLMQIQQRKHEIEPTFRLIKERNQQFFIEVAIGDDLRYVGSGKNKKSAKKKAAEGMLEKMGYSTNSGHTRLSSSERKKKKCNNDYSASNKKPLLPEQNIKSEKFLKFYENKLIRSKTLSKFEETQTEVKYNTKGSNSETKSSDMKHKKRLLNLAEQLNFKFQFSDPEVNEFGFVTHLSVYINPPRVFSGTGATKEQSQDKAAQTALDVLYETPWVLFSNMLRLPAEDHIQNEDLHISDKKNVITHIVIKETE